MWPRWVTSYLLDWARRRRDNRSPGLCRVGYLPAMADALFTVRPAVMSDVEFLTDVAIEATRKQGRLHPEFDKRKFRAGFGEWTEEQIRGDVPHSATSVIEVSGEPAGRLRVIRDVDRIELAGLQLLPHLQGRGIGTRIVEDLKAEAAAGGLSLDIGVEKDNPRARRLYERLGCVQVGEDDEEYFLQWRQ